MNSIIISFVIPMYNKEKYIRDTINSIFDSCSYNGFEFFEIIVIDDESTDKSYDKISDLMMMVSSYIINKKIVALHLPEIMG